MEYNKLLKRKRSDSFKSSSTENIHCSKIFKGERNSSQKKCCIQKKHYKKKYKYNDTYIKSKIVYPNHYWFGGSNNDPLNLNGLIDSGGMSHPVTPLPSPPFPSPHRRDFLVPVAHAINIYDPLNLCGEEDDDLCLRRRNRTRKRRRLSRKSRSKSRLNSLSDEGNTDGNVSIVSEKIASDLSSFKVNNELLSTNERTENKNKNKGDLVQIEKSNIYENLINEKPSTSGKSDTQNVLQSLKHSTSNQYKPLITPKSIKSNIKNIRYRHGNYNSYRSYLKPDVLFDGRLETLPRSAFESKDVLDVGCNVGHCSILMALKLGARSVVGVDVDARLIRAANKNLLHHAGLTNNENSGGAHSPQNSDSSTSPLCTTKNTSHPHLNSPPSHDTSQMSSHSSSHHHSHPLMRSILSTTADHPLMNFDFKNLNLDPSNSQTDDKDESLNTSNSQTDDKDESLNTSNSQTDDKDESLNTHPKQRKVSQNTKDIRSVLKHFPHNVSLIQQDYVPLSSLEVDHMTPKYDVIIALSLTKYIHLNHGDKGLQLTFRKMYRELRRGGRLVLQAHYWSSYKKQRHATEQSSKNYKSIKFYPSQFEEHLISLGFSSTNLTHFRTSHRHKASQQFMLELIKADASTKPSTHSAATLSLPPLTYPPSSTTLASTCTNSDVCSLNSVVSNVDSSSMLHDGDGDGDDDGSKNDDDDGGDDDGDSKNGDDDGGDDDGDSMNGDDDDGGEIKNDEDDGGDSKNDVDGDDDDSESMKDDGGESKNDDDDDDDDSDSKNDGDDDDGDSKNDDDGGSKNDGDDDDDGDSNNDGGGGDSKNDDGDGESKNDGDDDDDGDSKNDDDDGDSKNDDDDYDNDSLTSVNSYHDFSPFLKRLNESDDDDDEDGGDSKSDDDDGVRLESWEYECDCYECQDKDERDRVVL